ncbi:transcription factor IBH1-like [Cornus florida]|uniref:transcription factor IBH1-like n=1 Tax=Cornus florida TaxID=4283 RepID=UPI00289A11B3|nr:transcription factor IBH1-like [Cornus florida]
MYHPKGLSSKTSSFKTRVARVFLRSLLRIKKQKPILKSSKNTYVRSQKIKMAAYSSMARAVGTRRAWSRALLFKLRVRQRAGAVVRRRSCFGGEKKRVTKINKPSGDQLNQAEKLRRLVPGGEAMEFGDLLEETAHYIKCLATQVKVMKSIADHLYSPPA